jgi:hypothetical protein
MVELDGNVVYSHMHVMRCELGGWSYRCVLVPVGGCVAQHAQLDVAVGEFGQGFESTKEPAKVN